MRISTSMMFELSQNAMQNRQSDLSKVGLQLSTGKRIVSASDDPRAASQVLVTQQSLAVNSQYADSRVTARQQLSAQENVLSSVTDLVQSAKDLMVQAGNGTLSDVDRASLATQLEGLYQTAMGLGNSQDGNGHYLFAGSQIDQPAFATDASGVTSYQGDDSIQTMRVGASRNMATNHIGADIFKTSDADGEVSNLFNTLGTAVEALKTPVTDDNSAALSATLSTVSQQLDSSLDNVLTVRASMGSSLNELDVLDDIGTTRSINYQTEMSSLQDLDYAEAISRYSINKVGLEAAQKTFAQVQQLSLFDVL